MKSIFSEVRNKGRCKSALLYWMDRLEGQYQCRDKNLWYYSIYVGRWSLLYYIDTSKEHNQRMFLLNNSLASAMGFLDLGDMIARVKHLQWWRGAMTTRALSRHLTKKVYKYTQTRKREKLKNQQTKINNRG
jgi:hypothetical protein